MLASIYAEYKAVPPLGKLPLNNGAVVKGKMLQIRTAQRNMPKRDVKIAQYEPQGDLMDALFCVAIAVQTHRLQNKVLGRWDKPAMRAKCALAPPFIALRD